MDLLVGGKGRGVESIGWKGRTEKTWDLRAGALNKWLSGQQTGHRSASLEQTGLWPRRLGLKAHPNLRIYFLAQSSFPSCSFPPGCSPWFPFYPVVTKRHLSALESGAWRALKPGSPLPGIEHPVPCALLSFPRLQALCPSLVSGPETVWVKAYLGFFLVERARPQKDWVPAGSRGWVRLGWSEVEREEG